MRKRKFLSLLILAGCGLIAFGALSDRVAVDPKTPASAARKVDQPVEGKSSTELKVAIPAVTTPSADELAASGAAMVSAEATVDSDPAFGQMLPAAAAEPAQTRAMSKKATGGKFGPGVTGDTKRMPERNSSAGLASWRVFFSLALVAGLMALTFYFLKRFGAKISGLDPKSPLKVRSRVHLDHKASLALIKVHEEELLLAITPAGVSLLSKYAAISTEPGNSEIDDFADPKDLAGSFRGVDDFEQKPGRGRGKGRGE